MLSPSERLCAPRPRLLLQILLLRQPKALRQRRRLGMERHASEHPGQVRENPSPPAPAPKAAARKRGHGSHLIPLIKPCPPSLAADSYEWGSQSSGISAYMGGDDYILPPPPEELGHYWPKGALTYFYWHFFFSPPHSSLIYMIALSLIGTLTREEELTLL